MTYHFPWYTWALLALNICCFISTIFFSVLLYGVRRKERLKRSSVKGEDLTEAEMAIMAKGHCPDCGHQLYEGPEGGCAVMISCGGCSSTFTVLGGVGGPGHRTSDSSKLASPSPDTATLA